MHHVLFVYDSSQVSGGSKKRGQRGFYFVIHNLLGGKEAGVLVRERSIMGHVLPKSTETRRLISTAAKKQQQQQA